MLVRKEEIRPSRVSLGSRAWCGGVVHGVVVWCTPVLQHFAFWCSVHSVQKLAHGSTIGFILALENGSRIFVTCGVVEKRWSCGGVVVVWWCVVVCGCGGVAVCGVVVWWW
jgi:hypothetical protein